MTYRILLILAFFLTISGLFLPLTLYLNPKEGLGYNLGVVGTIMMAQLFIYSLKKRFKNTEWLPDLRYIFSYHIFLGIFGPILILYHCRFHLGATNSNVALWSMLIVSISGFIGKFLYHRIGWETLFKWWHFAHLPFVGLMLTAVTFHIIAAFIY